MDWNSVRPEFVDSCIHHLIAEQVGNRPNQQAVSAWDGDLTYRELDELSSNLAHHLLTLGAGPEVFIPVLFEKSMWVPVAWLAVLKSGSAIVPLDPGHPLTRLKDILTEVKATILLCSTMHVDKLADSIQTTFIVNQESVGKLPVHVSTPVSSVKPENAAYAIFTSGSTGRPKVRTLVNRVTGLHVNTC